MSGRELKARIVSEGAWGQVGAQDMPNRYAEPKRYPRQGRRWCSMCQKVDPTARNRSTHSAMVNGVCLTQGCLVCVERWVRDPTWTWKTEGD